MMSHPPGGWKFGLRLSCIELTCVSVGSGCRSQEGRGGQRVYEVKQTWYRFAKAGDEMPDGRVIHVVETPGTAVVIVMPGHASERLLDDLNEQHRPIMSYGNWLHRAPGTTGEAPEQIVEARWERTPAHKLPAGTLAMPLEGPGRFVWLILDTEVSERLVAEWNPVLATIVNNGLWIQRWGATL